MRFLKIYVKEEHRIKGLEPEAYPEIPDVALREAIVNAVAHRDYTISAPIRVFHFLSHYLNCHHKALKEFRFFVILQSAVSKVLRLE